MKFATATQKAFAARNRISSSTTFSPAESAVAPFEAEDANHAGEIRAVLEARGTPIGAYDILIAAQARRRGATLITANTGEFERVPGLLLIDWAA